MQLNTLELAKEFLRCLMLNVFNISLISSSLAALLNFIYCPIAAVTASKFSKVYPFNDFESNLMSNYIPTIDF